MDILSYLGRRKILNVYSQAQKMRETPIEHRSRFQTKRVTFSVAVRVFGHL